LQFAGNFLQFAGNLQAICKELLAFRNCSKNEMCCCKLQEIAVARIIIAAYIAATLWSQKPCDLQSMYTAKCNEFATTITLIATTLQQLAFQFQQLKLKLQATTLQIASITLQISATTLPKISVAAFRNSLCHLGVGVGCNFLQFAAFLLQYARSFFAKNPAICRVRLLQFSRPNCCNLQQKGFKLQGFLQGFCCKKSAKITQLQQIWPCGDIPVAPWLLQFGLVLTFVKPHFVIFI
jgi:hypothetical protein